LKIAILLAVSPPAGGPALYIMRCQTLRERLLVPRGTLHPAKFERIYGAALAEISSQGPRGIVRAAARWARTFKRWTRSNGLVKSIALHAGQPYLNALSSIEWRIGI
jgi:hypothetical protein